MQSGPRDVCDAEGPHRQGTANRPEMAVRAVLRAQIVVACDSGRARPTGLAAERAMKKKIVCDGSNGHGADLQDGEIVAPVSGTEICVRALRPTLHTWIADAVEAAHGAALRRHGVEGVVSLHAPLREANATWLLVAERARDGACCAGVRVDVREAGHSLPIERAVARFGEHPLALLRRRLVGRVGELAGLWVGDGFRGLGLADTLISAGVAAARRVGLTRLFSFPPLHTRPILDKIGFHVIRPIGDQGELLYPNDRYRSWVMALDLVPTHAYPRVEYSAEKTIEETSDERYDLSRIC